MNTSASGTDDPRTTSIRWWWLAVIGALVALVWTAMGTEPADAVPAGPGIVELEQPDGTTFKARQFGDEWYHGLETRSGHTILRRQGWWVYAARRDDGTLRATALRVGSDTPTMRRHLRDSERTKDAHARRSKLLDVTERTARLSDTPTLAATGSDPVLVILVQFQNQANLGTTQAQWASRYFGTGKSVADYYKKNSYNQFTFTPAAESHGAGNNGVVGWLTLPVNHPDSKGQIERTTIREAIKAADPFVNYASFDTNNDGTVQKAELHINVVMAGLEESTSGDGYGHSIWANRWFLDAANTPTVDGKKVGNDGFLTYGEKQRVQLTDGTVNTHQATVGVIVHELGHDLGLPDLYDTDGSTAGVGNWSTMGGGSWALAPTDATTFIGATPVMLDAWSRATLGWIAPDRVINVRTTTLRAAATGTRSNTTVQLLDNPEGFDWGSDTAKGSYYLVENRQQRVGSYDAGLPGSGLLILEVNEAYDTNASNGLVRVRESDGQDLLIRPLDGGNQGDVGDVWVGPDAWVNRPGGDTPAAVGRISSSSSLMTATFTAAPGVPPANDDFAQAQTLTGWRPPLVRTTNAFATEQKALGEPGTDGGADTPCEIAHTLWYRYTAPATGDLTVDLTGSSAAPKVAVYRGSSMSTLTRVGCDSGNSSAPAVVKNVRVAKGESVYLQVGAIIGNSYQPWWGDVDMAVTLRPTNDNRVGALSVTGRSFTHNLYAATATVEDPEPRNSACRATTNTLWYKVRPTQASLLSASTATSTFDTVAAVWLSTRNGLSPVACADDVSDSDATSRLSDVTLAANQTYYLQVGGVGGAASLTLDLRLRPGNDNFPGRTLTGAAGAATSFTTHATTETGEPTHDGNGAGRSVWWTWKAARSGRVTFDTEGSVADTVLAAYQGSAVGGLTQIAANDDASPDGQWSSVTFDTVAGQTYRIAVDNYGAASGDVRLRFREHTDLAADVVVHDVPGTTTFAYEVTVSRLAGASATPVVVDLTIPSTLAFGTPPPGCTIDAVHRKVRCDLGVVGPDGRGTVDVPVEPRTEGPHTGTVALVTADDDPAGNTASETATQEFVCDNDFTTGDDAIIGTDGHDILCGGSGDDQIVGGRGDDKLFGGAGNDTVGYSTASAPMSFDLRVQDGILDFAAPLLGRLPADGHDAAAGIEAVVATPYADVVTGRPGSSRDLGADTLSGGGGDDQIRGLGGPDRVYGGSGNDTIDGDAGADWIYGDAGSDVLRGGDDVDRLYGGTGADDLTGGAGIDTLDGGSESDTCQEPEDTRIACEA